MAAFFPFGRGNITKLQLIYFFSTLYFYIPVGTLYLRSRDLTYLQINSLWGIIVFTMFLTEVPTGVIADRIGHKRAVQLALGFQLLGEVIYLFTRGYPGFVLAAIIGGLGFAFGSGCVEALVTQELQVSGSEGEMSKAMGGLEAAQRLANLLAFAITGLIIHTLTLTQFIRAVALTAGMVGVGFALTFTLDVPADDRADAASDGDDKVSGLSLLRQGLQLLRENRAFRILALVSLLTIPFRDYLGSLYQPYFVRAGVAPVWFGLVLSAASGLSVLGARYAYWLEARMGKRLGLLLAVGLPGLLTLAMAGISHAAGSVALFCLVYGATSLRSPLISARLNAHISSANRATVLSLVSMLSGLYVAGMGLVIGRVADASIPLALVVMGGLVLIGTLVTAIAVRE
jgi:MFS family permease